jgi:hypothetical protein
MKKRIHGSHIFGCITVSHEWTILNSEPLTQHYRYRFLGGSKYGYLDLDLDP